MRTLVVALILLLASTAFADSYTFSFTEQIVAADTTAARTDTLISPILVWPEDCQRIDFQVHARALPADWGYKDSVMGTYYVKLQHSMDGFKWSTALEVDTLTGNFLTPDSIVVSTVHLYDTTVANWGPFYRYLLIYTDAELLEADSGIVGNKYGKQVTVTDRRYRR